MPTYFETKASIVRWNRRSNVMTRCWLVRKITPKCSSGPRARCSWQYRPTSLIFQIRYPELRSWNLLEVVSQWATEPCSLRVLILEDSAPRLTTTKIPIQQRFQKKSKNMTAESVQRCICFLSEWFAQPVRRRLSMRNAQLILCYVPQCSFIPSIFKPARKISACSVGRLHKMHAVVRRMPRPCTDR